MAKPSKPDPSDVMSALDGRLPASHLARTKQILEEMLVLYYPPFRAEDDVELLRLSIVGIRAYVEDLGEFQPELLEQAWRTVRRAHKVERWPTLQVIRDECLRLRDKGKASASRPVAQPTAAKPWEEKAKRITQLQRDYTDQFVAGALGHRAKEEGWYASLLFHVQDAAHYQAQEVVAGRRDFIDVTIDSKQIEIWKNGLKNSFSFRPVDEMKHVSEVSPQ